MAFYSDIIIVFTLYKNAILLSRGSAHTQRKKSTQKSGLATAENVNRSARAAADNVIKKRTRNS
jgi:hypothetical protein